MPSNLSVEDRRRKLRELKLKTECKDCGRKGHWRGDPQCTMKKAHLAIREGRWPEDVPWPTSFVPVGYSLNDEADEPEEEVEKTARMAIRRPEPAAPSSSSGSRRPLTVDGEMDWTLPDAETVPTGGERKFQVTPSLRGKTFIDVTFQHPQQYIAYKKQM